MLEHVDIRPGISVGTKKVLAIKANGTSIIPGASMASATENIAFQQAIAEEIEEQEWDEIVSQSHVQHRLSKLAARIRNQIMLLWRRGKIKKFSVSLRS